MNDMEIPMPTPEEKERAVAEILAACPRRPWLWRELEETFRAVGLKNLFFGTGDCLFLALLVLLLCLFPAAHLTVELGAAGPVLFFLSPARYAALVLLTAWKEQQSGTLELLGVARISLRMLAALRMLCFGGASVAVCVPISLTVWQLSNGALSLGWALSLSLSSLFLYGALSLFCQRMRGWPGLLGAPCAWAGAGAILMLWEKTAGWLAAVPAAAFCLAAAGGIALYLMELRRFCRRPVEGGISYAHS